MNPAKNGLDIEEQETKIEGKQGQSDIQTKMAPEESAVSIENLNINSLIELIKSKEKANALNNKNGITAKEFEEIIKTMAYSQVSSKEAPAKSTSFYEPLKTGNVEQEFYPQEGSSRQSPNDSDLHKFTAVKAANNFQRNLPAQTQQQLINQSQKIHNLVSDSLLQGGGAAVGGAGAGSASGGGGGAGGHLLQQGNMHQNLHLNYPHAQQQINLPSNLFMSGNSLHHLQNQTPSTGAQGGQLSNHLQSQHLPLGSQQQQHFKLGSSLPGSTSFQTQQQGSAAYQSPNSLQQKNVFTAAQSLMAGKSAQELYGANGLLGNPFLGGDYVNNLSINFINNIGALYGNNNMGRGLANLKFLNNSRFVAGNGGNDSTINFKSGMGEGFDGRQSSNEKVVASPPESHQSEELRNSQNLQQGNKTRVLTKCKKKEGMEEPNGNKRKVAHNRSKSSVLNFKKVNETIEEEDEIMEGQQQYYDDPALGMKEENIGREPHQEDANSQQQQILNAIGFQVPKTVSQGFKGGASQGDMMSPSLLAYKNLNLLNLLQNPGTPPNVFMEKLGINSAPIELPMNMFNTGLDGPTSPQQWMNLQLSRLKYQAQHQQTHEQHQQQQKKALQSQSYGPQQPYTSPSQGLHQQNQSPTMGGSFQIYQSPQAQLNHQHLSQASQGNYLHHLHHHHLPHHHQQQSPNQQPSQNFNCHQGGGLMHSSQQLTPPNFHSPSVNQPNQYLQQAPAQPALYYQNAPTSLYNSQSKLSPQQIAAGGGLNLLYGNGFNIPNILEDKAGLLEASKSGFCLPPSGNFYKPDNNNNNNSQIHSRCRPSEANLQYTTEHKIMENAAYQNEIIRQQQHGEADGSDHKLNNDLSKRKFHHRRTVSEMDVNKMGKKANNKNENKKFLEIIKQEVGPRMDSNSELPQLENRDHINYRNDMIVQDYASIFNQLQNPNLVSSEIERILDKPKTPALLSSVSPQCRELDHNQISTIFQRIGNQQNESPFLYNAATTPTGGTYLIASPFSMNNSPFLLQNSPMGIYVENVGSAKLESPSTFLITNPIVGVNTSPVDLMQRVIQNKNM